MAGTVIPYKHGVMELNGNVLQKWQSGNVNIETPKPDIKVMAEGGIVDGFISGPTKCSIDVENSVPEAGTEEDYESLRDSLHFYAEEITRFRPEALVDTAGTHSHWLVNEPVGVAVAFIAWNFPLLNFAFKIGPAMAAGCPVIIKPSAAAPLSAYRVGELCAEVGLPAGAVNILCGPSTEVGDTLSESTIPALITIIGSVATGRHVMRVGATSIKRYSMELGGNAPVLVFADADLDLAAEIVGNAIGVTFHFTRRRAMRR